MRSPTPRHIRRTLPAAAALLAAAMSSCAPAPESGASDRPHLPPLPLQQSKAYPETVTGLFVTLADFEPGASGGVADGRRQVARFRIEPPEGGRAEFVVNVTRTGVGAMEVLLPPGAELVFPLRDVRDLSGYTLLSVALYSRTVRDDLRVSLVGDSAGWTSPRILLQEGWNTVLVDLRAARQVVRFDVIRVRQVRLSFSAAGEAVLLNLDDLMLVDNTRRIEPTPSGVTLTRTGLDYRIELPLRRPLTLAPGGDGLWRLGGEQAVLRLAGAGESLGDGTTERLDVMGFGRIGTADVLEHNGVRVRLAATWYFPADAGALSSLAVRHVRWVYTFYGDGRWVTHVELNNAGGAETAAVGLWTAGKVAWAADGVSDRFIESSFPGPVGRWDYLVAPAGLHHDAIEAAYLHPADLTIDVGQADAYAPGDANRDRFDESQGCYFLAARAGNCRFTIHPPHGGLLNPAFRIAGPFAKAPQVSSVGLAIRDVVLLSDGSALFLLKEYLRVPTAIEVTGEPAMQK